MSKQAKSEEITQLLMQCRYGVRRNSALVWGVLINLFFFLVRPQNELKILETIKFPFILSILPFLLWLPVCGGRWTKQQKLMLVILAQGALWIPLARNNRYALEGFRTLAQIFIMVLFPLAMSFASHQRLESVFKLFKFTSFYLVLYAVTHGGHGPGDYLGDENDLALALVVHTALLLGVLFAPQKSGRRIMTFAACTVLIAGIVFTGSRGGFLGLAAVLIFHLLNARRRLAFLSVAVCLMLGLALFTPEKYWSRIRSITDTKSGSALERQETWGFAWDIFKRSEVMPFGVGMKNTPFYLGDYKTSESRNLWGRQAHSLYFEVLPDLGVFGFLVFLGLVGTSFFGNRKLIKRSRYELRNFSFKQIEPVTALGIKTELQTLLSYLLSVNSAWIGVLISGAFISIFYYPPIWILACMSGALQTYGFRVVKLCSVARELEESANTENAPLLPSARIQGPVSDSQPLID